MARILCAYLVYSSLCPMVQSPQGCLLATALSYPHSPASGMRLSASARSPPPTLLSIASAMSSLLATQAQQPTSCGSHGAPCSISSCLSLGCNSTTP